MPEQVGILLLFLVVVLFNLIRAVLSHRKRRDAAETAPPPVPVPPRVPPRVVVAPPRVEVSLPAPPAVRRPVLPVPARQRRGLDLGRPRDLRRAIVLMTVLGPCRALEHERSRETV